jgi:DNA modification methylase
VIPTSYRLIPGHALDVLPTLPDGCAQCVVTSPPYYGLRDYALPPLIWNADPECEHEWGLAGKRGGGAHTHSTSSVHNSKKHRDAHEQISQASTGNFCTRCGAWRGQLGLEPTYQLYLSHMVEIFREVRRVLHPTGTLWLNMGDSYSGSWGNYNPTGKGGQRDKHTERWMRKAYDDPTLMPPTARRQTGMKPKDMMGLPWRLAFALQDDGWYLRSDIIWYKPNVMPASVTDRPTTAHEYLFLFSRQARYYYDAEAIKEPCSEKTHARGRGINPKTQKVPSGWDTEPGTHGRYHREGRGRPQYQPRQNTSFSAAIAGPVEMRNKRTVWEIPVAKYSEAHFATYPEALAMPCILAGSRPGDTVLDPFCGSGTTLAAARRLGRNGIGIELSPEYLTRASRWESCRLRQRCGAGCLRRWKGDSSAAQNRQRSFLRRRRHDRGGEASSSAAWHPGVTVCGESL